MGTTVWVHERRRARRGDRAVGQRPRLLLPARRTHDGCGRESRARSRQRAGARHPDAVRLGAAWRATATAISRDCAPRSPRKAAPPRPRCARSTPRICVVSSPPRLRAATDGPRNGAGLRQNSRNHETPSTTSSTRSTSLYLGVLILRFIMQLVRANFRNPFAEAIAEADQSADHAAAPHPAADRQDRHRHGARHHPVRDLQGRGADAAVRRQRSSSRSWRIVFIVLRTLVLAVLWLYVILIFFYGLAGLLMQGGSSPVYEVLAYVCDPLLESHPQDHSVDRRGPRSVVSVGDHRAAGVDHSDRGNPALNADRPLCDNDLAAHLNVESTRARARWRRFVQRRARKIHARNSLAVARMCAGA